MDQSDIMKKRVNKSLMKNAITKKALQKPRENRRSKGSLRGSSVGSPQGNCRRK